MIYFDNAATTFFKPQQVVDTALLAMKEYSFNPKRGGKQSLLLEEKIFETRKKLGVLTGCLEENIVFCNNCTQALNMAILGHAKKGGHVITTVCEHNSVLRPLYHLKKNGIIDVSIAVPNNEGIVQVETIKNLLQNNTYMVIVNHVSNVTGQAQEIAKIGAMLKKYRDILFVVDSAQSMGFLDCDINNTNADLIAIPSHKGLHSIQGCGVLAFRRGAMPRPILFGGTGTESHLISQPTTSDGLEAGTLPTPAILCLSSAIDWWAENFSQNSQKIATLNEKLYYGLNLLKATVYSKPNKCGICAFNVGDVDSSTIADMLSQKDIAVRAGLHCAPFMHKWLNTSKQGAVRVSLSAQNTIEEVYTFLNVLEGIMQKVDV